MRGVWQAREAIVNRGFHRDTPASDTFTKRERIVVTTVRDTTVTTTTTRFFTCDFDDPYTVTDAMESLQREHLDTVAGALAPAK